VNAMMAREIGEWTKEKLEILAEYLGGEEYGGGFAYATKRARGTYYIDAFAGPGKCRVRDTGEEVDGSPLIALKVKPPFAKYFFFDSDPEAVKALRYLITQDMLDMLSRVTIIAGDCNDRIGEALAQVPQTAPCFAFLDPEGAELHWDTIVRIAQHKRPNRIEVLVLFPYDGLVRLMPRDPSKLVHAHIIDRVMPDPEEWRRIYEARIKGVLSAREARRAFADMYRNGLLSLGYQYVPPLRVVKGPRGPLYFLAFATDHHVGLKIMYDVFNKLRETISQLYLFERSYEDEY